MTREEQFNDYDGFVEKFKPKKTTDDCYTPPEIMEVIDSYVEDKFGYDRKDFIKPFFPGGDYEHEDYTGKIVVDNPPFSILSKIVDYYIKKDIKFFLFGPTLTINATIKKKGVSCIIIKNYILYENSAKVVTCFITNIPEKSYLVFDKDLSEKIKALYHSKKKDCFIRKIPDFVNAIIIRTDEITEPIYLDDYEYISKYDGKGIYGGGYIKKGSK